MLGILLADKPTGITSHDAVNMVRRRLGTRRVGHAGTLDPLATGLLVIAVGPATRFLQYLALEPKTYLADVRFGTATDSYDAEGEVTEEKPIPDNLAGAVEAAIPGFLGLVQQLPPMHSAVKVRGKALYHYARKGIEIEREPRTVHLGEITVLGVEEATVRMRVVCSGGTYIRTLAHDLGQAVGCGAHVAQLQRTQVGRFDLADAVSLDSIDLARLMPLAQALAPMPLVALDAKMVQDIREGRAIASPRPIEGALCGLLDPAGNAFSVARVTNDMLQPECVIPAEAIDGLL